MLRIRALAAALFAVLAVSLMGACNVFLGHESDTDPHTVLKSLWNDFNEIHAYIDIRMSDNQFKSWERVYEYYRNELLRSIPEGGSGGDMGGWYLWNACKGMLGELKDPHVSLAAPGGHFWTSGDDIPKVEEIWFDLSIIRENYLENRGFDKAGYFTYGRFKAPDNNIGYIYIESFMDGDNMIQQDWAREIDGITKYFQDEKIKAIIIDIRNNRGGLSAVAEYIAARFCSVQKNYMKSSAKNGPGRNDFSAPMTYRVKPEGTVFTKRSALLTNRGTVSAAEWFVMAMKTQNHVTHMGTATRGALSAKTARPMLNGWYYTISVYRVTDMDGTCFEGKGISPDKKYIFTGDPEEEGTTGEPKKDIQLEKVLEITREWVNP